MRFIPSFIRIGVTDNVNESLLVRWCSCLVYDSLLAPLTQHSRGSSDERNEYEGEGLQRTALVIKTPVSSYQGGEERTGKADPRENFHRAWNS